MIYTITLNPAIDRLIYLNKPLTKRVTNRIKKVNYDLGGKGLHVSHTLSKLNIDNQALGFVGELNFNKINPIINEKKVKHNLTKIKNVLTRESIIILEKPISGSIMLAEEGFEVSKEDKKRLIHQIGQNVTQDDWVIIAGSFPKNFTLEDFTKLIKKLKSIGCFIGCDLSDEALQKAVELEVDFIKPNEFEVKDIINDTFPIEKSLLQLSKKIKYVVCSRGSKGSYLAYDDDIYDVTPPQVKEVNDTGAGDCFVGAFIGMLYLQKSIEESLKIASACAASKVQYEDSTTFSLDEVKKFVLETTVVKN